MAQTRSTPTTDNANRGPKKSVGAMSDAYRETVESIESITVAFILAFVFRAFVVEAFVIPTGSMAATLYGEHWTHNCSDCGYEFAVGATRGPKGVLNRPPGRVHCPNCNWEGDEPQFTGADLESGDRILVLKWPWDAASIIPQLGPQRWDVTVFKDPKDGVTNFIKRMIGLPNEVLMLVDGDLYTAAAEDLPPELLEQLDLLRHRTYVLGETQNPREQRAIKNEIMMLQQGVVGELLPYLHIQRKTDDAQEALWSVVYDHDFTYRKSDQQRDSFGSSRPRWAPEDIGNDGWTVKPGILEYKSDSQRPGRLAFEGKPINDRYAYNTGPLRPAQYEFVTDYRLRFSMQCEGGDGALQVELGKYDDVFAVLFKPDGVVQLSRKSPESRRFAPLQAKVQPFVDRPSAEIEIRNVDYRLSVVIDGREVLATTNAEFSPNIKALLSGRWRNAERPPASIELVAQDIDIELRHIAIERDVYYISPTIRGSTGPWDDLPGWATTDHPILLRDDEFFVLGDNSPASEDGRLWVRIGPHLLERGEGYQIGTVPKDQLIGKAFFVYWPSGYKPSFLRWGIVPNVGRMRWIH